MTNDLREDSTMTMQTIDTTDPDDVRQGVEPLADGRVCRFGYVGAEYHTRDEFIADGWEVVE